MAKTYSPVSGAILGAVISVASATTTNLGAAAAPYLNITGTTAITGFGTAVAGTLVTLRFAAALTLTHNATSLILPGGANITTAAGDMAQVVSEGSGNWRCLWYVKASGLAVLGSMVGFTTSDNTATPNNTVNAARILVASGSVNADFVLQAKGSGAIIAQLPDGTTTGGNKRGQYAVDLVMVRTNAAYVASGDYSFSAGYNHSTTGAYAASLGQSNAAAGIAAMAFGYNNNATGNYCMTVGYNHTAGNEGCVSMGYNQDSSADYSFMYGIDGVSAGYCSLTFGRNTSNSGDYSVCMGRNVTLTSAADRTFIYNASNSSATHAISIAASNTAVFANAHLWLANTNNTASELRFYEAQSATGTFPAAGTNYTAFKAGVQSADITYTLPTADGSSGYVLSTNGSGTLSWIASSVTGFTAALNTSSPNNTVNASSLTASGGTTNQDFVIAPKGTGSLLSAIPDGTAAGGNKRGINAVDLQTSRSAATDVASGNYSAIVAGQYNVVSGTLSGVLAGYQQNVSGDYSAAIGGQANTVSGSRSASVAGLGNQVTGNYSVALAGSGAKTTITGQVAQGVGNFAATGDAQLSQYVVMAQTTNATPTEMLVWPGTINGRLVLQNNSTWTFSIDITGHRTGASESAGYQVKGVIRRDANAASTHIVGSVTKTDIAEDDATWDVTISADTTNGALKIEVTGAAAKNINWTAFVRSVEVIG